MDDATIISGLRSGDRDACESFVSIYGPRLLRAANGLCRSASDAEELVQETLVAAVRQVGRYRGRSALFTWLYGILRYKHLASQRKRRRLVNVDSFPEVQADVPAPGAESDRNVVGQAVADAVGRLSEEHRQVVLMRYGDGMKLPLIAEHLGVPVGTVKSRLYYALRMLRADLGEELNLFR